MSTIIVKDLENSVELDKQAARHTYGGTFKPIRSTRDTYLGANRRLRTSVFAWARQETNTPKPRSAATASSKDDEKEVPAMSKLLVKDLEDDSA